MRNLEISADSLKALWQTMQRRSSHLPEWLLLQHGRRVGLFVLVLMLCIATGFALWLLYVPADMPNNVLVNHVVELQTKQIDTLEFYIEEVQFARESGMKLPTRPIFER